MWGLCARLALIIFSAGLVCGCAATTPAVGEIPAAPRSILAPLAPAPFAANAAAMPQSKQIATIPLGFLSFCLRFTDQCQSSPGEPSAVVLTSGLWQTITTINESVNAAIWPEDDETHYGRAEYWTIPTDGYGDCEDFALTKQRDLMQAGLPQSALRIAIVIAPDGGRHSVLTVVTDKGDYVLDNLRNDVIGWNDSGYVWIERQDAGNPLAWVSLQAPALAMNTAATGDIGPSNH